MGDGYRVILRAQAFSDLDGIFEYIRARAPENASNFIDYLNAELETLTQLPSRHPVHHQHRDPTKTVRAMVVDPYLAYYRVNEVLKVVTVLTIRHGARRQPKRFK